jgi:hypothetical protein
VSGSGKTSLLSTFAEYLWETYQRVLALYSWDGGAIPTDVQRKIQQGLIRFWRTRTRSATGLALETIYLATKGYWPRRIDPKTGETSPAVELVPPVTVRYEQWYQGQKLASVPAASLIKPLLKPGTQQLIPVSEMEIREIATRTKGFELIGGVAYDGISSMSEVVMHFQDQQRGLGLIGGEKSSFGGVVKSGDLAFGGNNRADVGFAQTRAAQFVSNTLSIPYLVESPIFTGLSTEGTDQGGLSLVGLNLPGQAALTQAPQWFGNIVECDRWTDTEGKDHRTLNLQPFTDSQGRRHLLKSSASPWGVPDRLIDPAKGEGEPFSEFNLGKVFRLLDDDLKRSLESSDLSGVPGMPDGMLEVGEPAGVTDAGPTPAPTVPAVQAGRPQAPPQAPAAPTMPKAPQAPQAPSMPPPALGQAAPAGQPAGAAPIAPSATKAAAPPIPKGPAATAAPPPGPRPPARAPTAVKK